LGSDFERLRLRRAFSPTALKLKDASRSKERRRRASILKTIQNYAANLVSLLFDVSFFALRLAERNALCSIQVGANFASNARRSRSENGGAFGNLFALLEDATSIGKVSKRASGKSIIFLKSVSSPKNALFPTFFPVSLHVKNIKVAATAKV